MPEISTILAALERHTPSGFSPRDDSAVRDCVRRRMRLHRLKSISAYASLVQENPAEAEQLYRALLCGHTPFFRDPDAFAALRETVIAPLVAHKRRERHPEGVRLWVAGCASGEEAWSLACLLRDEAEHQDYRGPLVVLASDNDPAALEFARRGRYPAWQVEREVPDIYRDRVFTADSQGYRVKEELRDFCLFLSHDLLRDPPCTRLDLVACPELLSFYEAPLRDRVLPLLHCALLPDGVLLPGPCMDMRPHARLFLPQDDGHRLYRRRHAAVSVQFPLDQSADPQGAAEDQESKLARLAAIVDCSHEVIIGTTLTGLVTDWNLGAQELYGYTPEEIIGRHISLLVPPEKRGESSVIGSRVKRGEALPPFETVRMTRDGERVHVVISISPIENAEGKLLGISSVAHNITPRIRAERKLAELNRELEARVKKRTEQLRNLTAALLGLEQEERRNLSYLLHDELQQMVATAKLLVHRMESEATRDDLKEHLQETGRILDGVIQVSRNISMELSPPLILQTGIFPALDWLVRWSANQHALQVDLTLEGQDRPVVEEVGYFLFRAVKELLLNVVRHADVKHAALTAEFDRNGNLRVTVEDRGKGFDPSPLAHTTDTYGLLSITERTEAMGGRFHVASSPGEGSRFTFELPAEVVCAAMHSATLSRLESPEDEEGEAAWESAGCDGGIKVLLVDDHQAVRQGLRMLLGKRDGYRLLEARDGFEALDKAARLRPDVILMDIRLPRLDGIEATRRITAEYPDIPVIGLAPRTREGAARAMRQAGACDCLSKDRLEENLFSAIQRCLGAEQD